MFLYILKSGWNTCTVRSLLFEVKEFSKFGIKQVWRVGYLILAYFFTIVHIQYEFMYTSINISVFEARR